MRRNLVRTTASLLVIFINASYGNFLCAKNLYVSASAGNDSYTYAQNDANHPFLTIQKALNVVLAGDVIFVKPGIYKQNLTWITAGILSSPVTLQKTGNGIVYIKSADASAAPVLKIQNKSNIIIDGLHFTRDNAKNNATGLVIESSGVYATQNIEVRNCKFTGINWNSDPDKKPSASQNSQPLIVYGRSSEAIHNIYIHDCEFANNITGQSEVCSMNANIDSFTISNNKLYDNTNIPIDAIGHEGENSNLALDQARNGLISGNIIYRNQSPYAEGAGIYVDGGKSIIIEKNLIYNGDYGIEISAENNTSLNYDVQDITVRNNIIYNCRSAGIRIGAYRGMLQNAYVVNNTCFYNNRGGRRNGDTSNESNNFSPQAELVLSNMQDVTVENNIFYARSGVANLQSDGKVTLTNVNLNYNLWCSKASADGGNGVVFQFNNGTNHHYNSWSNYQNNNTANWDRQSRYGNPAFVNEAISGKNIIKPDLHIQSGSPAIAGGNPSSVIGDAPETAGTADYYGNERKTGIIDIGAHELASGSKENIFSTGNDLEDSKNIFTWIYPGPFTGKLIIEGSGGGRYIVLLHDISRKKDE